MKLTQHQVFELLRSSLKIAREWILQNDLELEQEDIDEMGDAEILYYFDERTEIV